MHNSAQNSFPFPMNDSDIMNPLFQTGIQVVGNQLSNLGRMESMQIKCPIYWEIDRLRVISSSPFFTQCFSSLNKISRIT
jgi:hypothetical protein